MRHTQPGGTAAGRPGLLHRTLGQVLEWNLGLYQAGRFIDQGSELVVRRRSKLQDNVQGLVAKLVRAYGECLGDRRR